MASEGHRVRVERLGQTVVPEIAPNLQTRPQCNPSSFIFIDILALFSELRTRPTSVGAVREPPLPALPEESSNTAPLFS